MTILKIIYGNIKDEGGNADVVVNASNEAMVIGDGVAGAIGVACGEPALTCDCKEFIRELKEVHNMAKVPTGSMGVTGAHAMTRAKAIFHAVAPICASRNSRTLDQARQLRMAYTLVFEAAAAHEYKVVTLPFLGAGIFNYPREESVDFALICALNACSSITSVEEIRFVSLNKELVQRMHNMLGGYSASVTTRNDAQPFLDRIPLASKIISGNLANNADIVKCFQFCLDSHRAIARANRVLMALQPRPPIRRTVMGAVAAMVHGEDIPRKIKLDTVKKADKAEVDYFIVFGDYCIDPNGLQIDLGPFGAFKDQIVHALSQSSQSDSDWASAVISLTIADNLRPKELICIVRQNGNASFSGLLKLIAENLSFHRRHAPFAKVGVIIPTTCVLNDKYRFHVPIFLILCVWKHSMTQLKGAVMLWSGTD
ncbi:hypothetical protein PRIPAC_78561, partial [Pristionchus pacificus]|uniref:Macro domain-containing protein n=1 Tax=Pristionchus pacificus TaxID=54126 RepID=A0A2A6CPH7_PRIPA